jgi:hypothetical protein
MLIAGGGYVGEAVGFVFGPVVSSGRIGNGWPSRVTGVRSIRISRRKMTRDVGRSIGLESGCKV